MQALRQIDAWEVPNAAAALVGADGVVARRGDGERVFRWASVTKPATALAVLVAAEEGTLDLDEPAGPEGSTVRHLLAHASGLPFDGGAPIGEPGRRRIYSNAGFNVLAGHLGERAGMSFEEYLRAAVLQPLGIGGRFDGDAGAGLWGTLDDVARLARELLSPTLVASETHAEMTAVAFPGLDGVLPDWGRMEPNDWGLGVELKDGKAPHWTGSLNSPHTYGHFGGSGTFLWVDPERGLGLACLTDREFGEWAKPLWPAFSDAVLAEAP